MDLDEAPAAETGEISPGVILDSSADGKVVGIEMLYLSKRVADSKLMRIQFETVGARVFRFTSRRAAGKAKGAGALG